MSDPFQNLINEFVMMWVLIDPIGTVPVFLLATRGMPQAQQRRIAIRSTCIAAGVLLNLLSPALKRMMHGID